MDRPSPWYLTAKTLKTSLEVDPIATVFALLPPDRQRIRVGVLMQGRETSAVMTFEQATLFVEQVQRLIEEKGAR